MDLIIFTEARFHQVDQNRYYSDGNSFSYQMFKKYLTVFDKVYVVARASETNNHLVDENNRVNKNGVELLPLPYYIGPSQYLRVRNKLLETLRYYIDRYSNSAVICRVPGTIGTEASKYLLKKNKPYGVEVVGDPSAAFAPGASKHPFRFLFRFLGARALKSVLKGASVYFYVTKGSLQSLYPPEENRFSTSASDVVLHPDAFAEKPKKLKIKTAYKIIAVGSLEALYKAPDVAIDAIALLEKKGLNVELTWLGDGRFKRAMIEYSKEKYIVDRVKFIGNVANAEDVRTYLDLADLFVLPSRTEGLPRAIVEAMARGLPCISTEVGGIPELLDEVSLVPVNNSKLLADKIIEFLTEQGLADAQAARNLEEAKSYAFELLEAKRIEFYQYLKSITQR